jgi:hypothetical protein
LRHHMAHPEVHPEVSWRCPGGIRTPNLQIRR